MNSWFNLLVGNLSSTIVAVCWKIRKKFLCISGSLVYPQVYPDRNQESLYQTNPNTAFWIASQIIQNFHALAASPQRWVPFNNPSKKPYAISQCLTHLKINIAPENGRLEDYFPFGKAVLARVMGGSSQWLVTPTYQPWKGHLEGVPQPYPYWDLRSPWLWTTYDHPYNPWDWYTFPPHFLLIFYGFSCSLSIVWTLQNWRFVQEQNQPPASSQGRPGPLKLPCRRDHQLHLEPLHVFGFHHGWSTGAPMVPGTPHDKWGRKNKGFLTIVVPWIRGY